MDIDLTNPIFSDENKARKHFESLRWPEGPVCPHCKAQNQATLVKGKSHRKGMYQCNSCENPFSVTVGTVMERSHVALTKWAMAFHLYAASKKGMSAHQLHRMLGVTYKTAWFMAHRIREAMGETNPSPLGGNGKVVEVDETFIGKPEIQLTSKGWQKKRGTATKRKVITVVERGGKARSFKVYDFKPQTIEKVLFDNIDPKSRLHTDEAHHYRKPAKKFSSHERVIHSSNEYARGDVTTNTVEGFFSIFKRGMRGVYHHCGEQHLHRYLKEFDFRYSYRKALGINDTERAAIAIRGIEGKRIMYR